MLGYYNTEIVVNISKICHFNVFPWLFLCGCNVVFIVPYHDIIIYMNHKINNYFSKFLENRSFIINIIVFEIDFHKNIKQFILIGSWWLFEAIHGFEKLTYFMLLSLHNKSFSFGHKKILFHISIQEDIFYIHLMYFPTVLSFQEKECLDRSPFSCGE